MSSPESPSSSRPLRVAGLALLGLAAIALIVGLISIFGGGDGDDTAKPPPTTSTSGPGSSGEQPPSSSGTSTTKPPESSSSAPATTTTTPPSGTSGTAPVPPPGGDGNGEPGKSQPVRVYNNSTVSGLASKAADDLRAVGWNVISVGNYPYGTISNTSVYYRPDTAEQQAAEDIADDFGMKLQARFTGLKSFPDGVIVIVTNDYQGIGGSDEGK